MAVSRLALNASVRRSLVRAASSSSSAAAAEDKLPSFSRALFMGKINTGSVYPYPVKAALDEETKSTLQMVMEPAHKFFTESNDAAKNDKAAKVPDDVLEQLKGLGAFGLQVPAEFEGAGLSNTGYARMTEIVGANDLGIGILMGAHQSIGYKGIMLYGTPEQKAKYLPDLATGRKIAAFVLTEPGAGSDAAGIKTRAKLSADGKHYILNGSKIWISNGPQAEIMTVFAKTEVEDVDKATGQKVMKDKMIAFIVERSFGGVTSGPPEDKMGIKCSPTSEVFFNDCKVPVENVLLKPGDGFKIAMGILNSGRFGMGAALTGTMKTAMKGSIEYANSRLQFGKKLKEFGVIQEKLAVMASKLYATESMAYLLASNMDKGMTDYQVRFNSRQ
jgi:very long chain acyl-CoA dehydrogenase